MVRRPQFRRHTVGRRSTRTYRARPDVPRGVRIYRSLPSLYVSRKANEISSLGSTIGCCLPISHASNQLTGVETRADTANTNTQPMSLSAAAPALLVAVVLAVSPFGRRALLAGSPSSSMSTTLCGDVCQLIRREGLVPFEVARVRRWNHSLHCTSCGGSCKPILLVGLASAWPALLRWQQPGYLRR